MTRARGAAAAALFLSAALAAEFTLARLALDRHVSRRASEDLHRLAASVSPFRWEFDSDAEIREGRSRGCRDLRVRDGRLEAIAADSDPFVTLEQEGRLAEPNLFTRFSARIRSERRALLQIHVTRRGADGILESPLLDLEPGWQDMRLDLASLSWRKLRFEPGADSPAAATVVSWPTAGTGIESLRIDPVAEAGVAFAIDWVRLDSVAPERRPDLEAPIERRPLSEPDPTGAAFLVHPLALAAARTEPVLAALRRRALRPPIVELEGGFPTPERLLAAIDSIREAAPAAIVFPRRIESPDLEPVGTESLGRAFSFQRAADAARRSFLSASAIAAVALALAWAAIRGRVARRARAAVDLVLCLAMAGVLLAASRDFGESAAPGALVASMLALGLVVALQGEQARPAAALGLRVGSARPWALAALATIVPLVAMVAIRLAMSDADGEMAPIAQRLRRAGAYAGFALGQQFLLGPVVARRLVVLFGERSGPAALGGALVFSLLHFPNFALMGSTLFMGTVWAALFVRFGTILPGAASHATLGTAFALLAPEGLRRSGLVGFRYFL